MTKLIEAAIIMVCIPAETSCVVMALITESISALLTNKEG